MYPWRTTTIGATTGKKCEQNPSKKGIIFTRFRIELVLDYLYFFNVWTEIDVISNREQFSNNLIMLDISRIIMHDSPWLYILFYAICD